MFSVISYLFKNSVESHNITNPCIEGNDQNWLTIIATLTCLKWSLFLLRAAPEGKVKGSKAGSLNLWGEKGSDIFQLGGRGVKKSFNFRGGGRLINILLGRMAIVFKLRLGEGGKIYFNLRGIGLKTFQPVTSSIIFWNSPKLIKNYLFKNCIPAEGPCHEGTHVGVE